MDTNKNQSHDISKAVAKGIWRQKNQEFSINLLVYVVVLPALFVWACVSCIPQHTTPSPTSTSTSNITRTK